MVRAQINLTAERNKVYPDKISMAEAWHGVESEDADINDNNSSSSIGGEAEGGLEVDVISLPSSEDENSSGSESDISRNWVTVMDTFTFATSTQVALPIRAKM